MSDYGECESRWSCDEARAKLSAAESEIERLRAALEKISNECGYGLGNGGDHANDIAEAALSYVARDEGAS